MKSLSSHIKHITEIQNADYYDSLTEEEKENFDKSSFFIFQKLELCMDLIPILDKYKSALKGIKGKRLYTALIEIIPKGKYEYIQLKKKKGVNYNPTFIGLLVKEYGCSITTSKEYIDIYIAKGVELEEFNKLKGKYGMK